MSMPVLLVIIGALLFVVALAQRPWHVRVKNVKGNTTIGSVKGSVSQTYVDTKGAGDFPAPSISTAQVITWVIAVAGALIAAVGVYINATRP